MRDESVFRGEWINILSSLLEEKKGGKNCAVLLCVRLSEVSNLSVVLGNISCSSGAPSSSAAPPTHNESGPGMSVRV